MAPASFEKEQISVCGFGSELDLISRTKAKAWLSLTPANENGVVESYDNVKCARVIVNIDSLSDDLANEVVNQVEMLPRPLVISCASGARASSVAWLHIAKKNDMTFADVSKEASGSPWMSKPPLFRWVKDGISA